MDIKPAVRGQIRVGRRVENRLPKYANFTSIVVLMKSHSKWWPLSPYYLKTKEGCLMENVWQFAKVYQQVSETACKYSHFDKRIIWKWPAETHVDKDGNILPEYWLWRQAGLENQFAVRYPVGFNEHHDCLYSLIKKDGYGKWRSHSHYH
jgi:hypothetical protein